MSFALKIRRSRSTDPETSKQGAQDVDARSYPQRTRLLAIYAFRARTDDEAAIMANLMHTCYWKRCSELRELGHIEPVKLAGKPLTRKGHAGSERMVCRITDAGREELRNKGLL